MTDAKVDTPPTGPWTATIVARALEWVTLDRMEDGGIIAHGGPYLYAISVDGKIRRLGMPADYISFLPGNDEEIVGYAAARTTHKLQLRPSTTSRPILYVEGPPEQFFAWSGSSFTTTTDRPEPRPHLYPGETQKPLSDGGPPSDAFPDLEWTTRSAPRSAPQLRRSSSRAVVWIGHKKKNPYAKEKDQARGIDDPDQTAFAESPDSKPRLVEIPSDPDIQPERVKGPRECVFIDAVDGGIYLHCTTRLVEYQTAERFYKFAAVGRWLPIKAPAYGPGHSQGGWVVDAEGSLWFWEDGSQMVRLAENGEIERFSIPMPPADLTAPEYREDGVLNTSAEDGAVREWRATKIWAATNPVSFIGRISTVLPRREGSDVWIVAHASRGGLLVVRLARTNGPDGGTSPSAPPPILIRSDLDQQNEIRNARGARRWVGRCNNIFVPFPSSSAADAFFAEHKTAIEAAVAKLAKEKTKGRAEVEIVEGTFDGQRRVAGALFLRTFPEASEELIEAAASRVAEIVTTNPATPPDVMCAVPTLDRIIHTVKVAPKYDDGF